MIQSTLAFALYNTSSSLYDAATLVVYLQVIIVRICMLIALLCLGYYGIENEIIYKEMLEVNGDTVKE